MLGDESLVARAQQELLVEPWLSAQQLPAIEDGVGLFSNRAVEKGTKEVRDLKRKFRRSNGDEIDLFVETTRQRPEAGSLSRQ